MVDVAVAILQVVVEIRDVAEGIQENDEQARRLSKRVRAIQPAVLAVKNGEKRLPSESLHQVLETVRKIRNFLDEYARMTKLSRVWKRRSNAAKFKDFSLDLSDGREALQLDVVVDTWAKEDASDRLEDIEHLKAEMKTQARNSVDNRAEFSRAVKVSPGGDPLLRCRSVVHLAARVRCSTYNHCQRSGLCTIYLLLASVFSVCVTAITAVISNTRATWTA